MHLMARPSASEPFFVDLDVDSIKASSPWSTELTQLPTPTIAMLIFLFMIVSSPVRRLPRLLGESSHALVVSVLQ